MDLGTGIHKVSAHLADYTLSAQRMNDANPLLADRYLIPFHRLAAEHVEPGIRSALEQAQHEIDALADLTDAPTWGNTLGRLDAAVERLSRRISPATHLVAVAETPCGRRTTGSSRTSARSGPACR